MIQKERRSNRVKEDIDETSETRVGKETKTQHCHHQTRRRSVENLCQTRRRRDVVHYRRKEKGACRHAQRKRVHVDTRKRKGCTSAPERRTPAAALKGRKENNSLTSAQPRVQTRFHARSKRRI